MDGTCPECGSAMGVDPERGVPVCPSCRYGEGGGPAHAGGPGPGADNGTHNAVCARGHALVRDVLDAGGPDVPCPECGAHVITGCPWCGLDFDTIIELAGAGPRCPGCGRPFPWNPGAPRAWWLRLPGALYAASAGAAAMSGALAAAAVFG